MKAPIVKTLVMLIAVLAIGALVATDAAAQVNATSGKSKITYTKREMVPVGDMEGHVLLVSDAAGTNENTGKWGFMEGASTFARTIVDMTKGNGTMTGYFILSKDGNLAAAKLTGTVRTVLSPEGKPLTSYSGEWKWVKCTGIYEGCTGQGVFQGSMISENEVLVEYRGILAQ